MDPQQKICVGKITGAHGLRGLVRLRSFTQDPADVASYPLADKNGKTVRVTLKTPMAQEFIAEIEGVASRTAAENLRGTELFTERAALPPAAPGEYYHTDLVGLRVEDESGAPLGTVVALHDFGAGSMIEVKFPTGRTAMLPFRNAFVPVVDIAAGRVVATPPGDWLDTPKPDKAQGGTR